MKKYLGVLVITLVFLLSSCKKELEYECNITDHAFIPFFDDESYSFNGVNLGKLNQCNTKQDTLEESNQMVDTLYKKLNQKNLSIEPDISGIEAYIDYYSNTRKYPDDLVSYNIFDTYNGTMELAFIYEAYTQMDLFVEYYKDPVEGEINDFELSDEFYKMEFYVNEDYLYYVQYHNSSGSQFTVTRIHFTNTDELIFDYLTYFKEGKSYNYEYTYYQEGIKGVQVTYRRYDEKKGMLDVREADFITGYIEEYHMSNYINPMFKLHTINPADKTIIEYSQEIDKYKLNKEIYDSNGFKYGEVYDSYDVEKYDYRFNISHLINWDYYFQNNLYIYETNLKNENAEVFVNTKIKLGGFITIYQHFEYIYHSDSEIYSLPNNILFSGLSSAEKSTIEAINKDFVDAFFISKMNNENLQETELFDLWAQYVPAEFVRFIEENK